MKKLKQILYIISIIPPIVDLLKGAYKGLLLGLTDIANGNTLKAERQQAEWEKANKG